MADRAKADEKHRVEREATESSIKKSVKTISVGESLTKAELENCKVRAAATGEELEDVVSRASGYKTLMVKNQRDFRILKLRRLETCDAPEVPYGRPEWCDVSGLSGSVPYGGLLFAHFGTFLDRTCRELHTWRHTVGRLDDLENRVPELRMDVRSIDVPLVGTSELDFEWTGDFVQEYAVVTVGRAAWALANAVRGDVVDVSSAESWYGEATPAVLQRCAIVLKLLHVVVPLDSLPVVGCAPLVGDDVCVKALRALVDNPEKIAVVSCAIGRVVELTCLLYGCTCCQDGAEGGCVRERAVGSLELSVVYKLLWDEGLCDDPVYLEKFLEVKREVHRLCDVRRCDLRDIRAQQAEDLGKALRCPVGAIVGPPTRAEIASCIDDARDELYRLRVCCVDDLYSIDLHPDGEAEMEVYSVAELRLRLPFFFQRLAMKDDEYPSALMRQYRIHTYYPTCEDDIRGLVLSPRGVSDPGDGSGLQFSVCHECARSLRSSEAVPRFSIANHFLIGCLREHHRLENVTFEPTLGDIKVTTPVYNHATLSRIFSDPKGRVMMQGHTFLTQVSIVTSLKNFPRRTDEALYRCVIGGALQTDAGWTRRLANPLIVTPCAWTIAEFYATHNPRFKSWEGVDRRGSFETYPSRDGLFTYDDGKERYAADSGGPALDVSHVGCGQDSCPTTTSIRVSVPVEEPLSVSVRRFARVAKGPVDNEGHSDVDCDG